MTVPREEEEKVALRGAENKWGKDSDSYLEVRGGGGLEVHLLTSCMLSDMVVYTNCCTVQTASAS